MRRHDSTYNPIGNTSDVDAEVLQGLLNFIDSNTQVPEEIVVSKEVKDELQMSTPDVPEIKDDLTPLRQLSSVTFGIREQCKLITDLTYQMDSPGYGNEILQKITDLYKQMYSVCRKDSPVLPLRKDHLKFKVLSGVNRKKGLFRRRRIVPLFPTKTNRSRQAKQSRFGRKSTSRVSDTTIDLMLNPEAIDDDDDNNNDTAAKTQSPMEWSDTEDNIAPFVDLAAYKSQDVIKQKVFTTPGLLFREHIHAQVEHFIYYLPTSHIC